GAARGDALAAGQYDVPLRSEHPRLGAARRDRRRRHRLRADPVDEPARVPQGDGRGLRGLAAGLRGGARLRRPQVEDAGGRPTAVTGAREVPRSALPSLRFRRRAIAIVASSAAVAAALIALNANPLALFRDFHFVVNLVSQMLPPNFALLWHK